jgi:hypothetical protein
VQSSPDPNKPEDGQAKSRKDITRRTGTTSTRCELDVLGIHMVQMSK